MYILVNNNPINVFSAYISEIMQFEPEISYSLVHNYYAESQYTNQRLYRLYFRAIGSKALIVNKIQSSKYQEYYNEGYDYYECIRKKKNSGFLVYEDTRGIGSPRYYSINYDKDNYYFYIDDVSNQRTVLSSPYPTKEEAEEARNKLLQTINKVVASLRKIEI